MRWMWLLLVVLGGAALLTLWQEERTEASLPPITYRDFSLFLWQNPSFQPAARSVCIAPEEADAQLDLAPAVVYRYYAWKRLVGKEVAARPIPADELLQFLQVCAEWMPKFWAGSDEPYRLLVERLEAMGDENVMPEVPLPVRIAFIGWKNAFLEKEKIAAINPSEEQMKAFLDEHPHYGRNYWRNLIPGYLEGSLSPFLRLAFYNYSVMTD